MTSLLIENAMVLTLEPSNSIIERGFILVRDDKIVAAGEGAYLGSEPASEKIDASGFLVTPGLVNAHTHSQSSTMSGFGDCLSHPSFMWLTQAHTSRRNSDEIRLAVLLTALQMLMTGTTAAIDHFPGQRFSADDMDAVLSAWDESGIRAVLAMRFFDGEFSDIFPKGRALPQALTARMEAVEILQPQSVSELRDLMQSTIGQWNGRSRRLSVFPAPSNPDRCSDAALLLCADLAERYDVGIHTHLLETERQARLAIERNGKTVVAHLKEIGVLSERWSCAHSIWLSDGDIDLLAKSGAIAVLNPESNARLGTGVARVPELLKAGVRLAIGTDGCGANDNLAMHEAMRAVANLHRTSEPNRKDWIRAEDVLRMAILGGAAALHNAEQLGVIAPGYFADLVFYKLDHPWWVPINDIVGQLVFAETGASVAMVMVGGRLVFANGKPTTFDADAVIREVREMARHLRVRNADLFEVAEQMAEVVP